MRCPKCGFEQPDGLAECGKCGVVIAKAMRPAAPRPAASPSPSPAPAPMPTGDPAPVPDDAASPGVVVLIGLLLLVFAGAAWWLNFPSIAPLPEGAYINEKHRFAFAPPAEWLQLTRENAKQIFEQHQDRLP